MSWILLVLFYGAVKGCREIIQKKAMTRNSIMEILVFYTLLSFIFVVPQAKDALGMVPKFYLLIALKSFIIFLAWICSFNALKRLPVSLFGILDMTGVLFATMLGVVFLGESLSVLRVLGLVTVCGGLLLLKFKPRFFRRSGVTQQSQASRHFVPKSQVGFYTAIAVLSCLLNAVSGFLDKLFMKDVTTSQLQFWYLLFLCAYYVLYIFVRRIKVVEKRTSSGGSSDIRRTNAGNGGSPERVSLSVVKNGWVWLLAVLFVAGDKALFMANGIPESSVSVMTLIKQSSCIVTILGGRIFFKEKDTGYKLFCAAVIIVGILLGTISA